MNIGEVRSYISGKEKFLLLEENFFFFFARRNSFAGPKTVVLS